jgi:hypothetical protein
MTNHLASLVALAVASQGALVLAQAVGETPKPSTALPLQTPVIGYLIMALFGAALIGISLLPSKRGHQD